MFNSKHRFYLYLSINSDTTIMNSVPRLECMALAKVAIMIYSNPEVINYEKNCYFHGTPNEKWEPFVKEKMSDLPLPDKLKERVIGLIKPLSFQHYSWRRDHVFILRSSFQAINYFSWTSVGMIDWFKTTKRIIHHKDLTLLERFILGSVYCFEDDLQILWENASATERKHLIEPTSQTNEDIYQEVLLMWYHWIKENADQYPSISNSFLRRVDVLPSSLQQKRSPDFAEFFLGETPHHLHGNSNRLVQRYMFREGTTLYERQPLNVLILFLQWPFQIEFKSMVDRLWNLVTEKDFLSLLCVMSDKIDRNWKDFDYVLLLNELWKKGPENFQKYVEKNISYQRIGKHISM